MPNLILEPISQDFKLKKSDYEVLMNCYKNKNLSALKDISNDLYDMSEYLLQCIGGVDEK